MATPFDFVTAEHFQIASDPAAAQSLFKRSVTMVEIEVFSFCNRRCWFCPNSTIDRISQNTYMRPEMYTGILQQMAGIGYAATISYSRYNEPLADKVILDRIREARTLLPHCTLHTNTNGDYLTRDYLAELHDAGLNSLNIQVYRQNEERYDHERMRERHDFIVNKLGLPVTLIKDRPGEWLESQLQYCDMKIRLRARNFAINGSNRGETIGIRPEYVRTSPCLSPFRFVYVDYNGKVMPCCNLRSDVPGHETYEVYDLAETNDIVAAYAQSALVQWRRSLIGWQEKGGVCRGCAFPANLPEPSEEDLQVHAALQAGML